MLPSKRVIASYVLDWVVIVVLAAGGGGLNLVHGNHRPFSLLDLSISYPFVQESISVLTLGLVALVAPAVIIVLVCLIFVPGRSARSSLTRRDVIRKKLWEVYVGITGLALSIVVAFFITQGLKNIFGKPRPHLIALCRPGLTNIGSHVVGGYGQDISVRWTLVDSSICTQSDKSMLNDGFRSFPSGHCSFSWSGLLYLSLFFSSKFAIAIPYLSYGSNLPTQQSERRSTDTELLPLHHQPGSSSMAQAKSPARPDEQPQDTPSLFVFNQAAAPPNYGLILLLIPVAVAAYISSTRYVQFWHFGFDVISGALIGILSAWFSFRWYHLPIRRGQGWAWGPRSRDRAFAIGVGLGNYAGPEG